MRQIFNILGLLIILQSCDLIIQNDNVQNTKSSDTDLFDKYSNDSIRERIYKIAYNHKSTAPCYIVFKAKDLNTGLIKEICCEAPFLSGAMHRELEIEFDTKGIEYIDSLVLIKRDSIFEFKNTKALENISFHSYPDIEAIKAIALLEDIDYFVENFGNNDSISSINFGNERGYLQEVFAHIMFKCGIITSRDCIAGNYIWFGDPRIELIIDEEMNE